MKDPYVYEGTKILKNKLNIHDESKLDKAETDFATIAIKMLKNSDFQIDSIFDCLTIHEKLFGRVYDWAGQLRKIDMFKGEPLLGGKSVDYVYSSYLVQALNELDDEFEQVDFSLLDPKKRLEKVCYFVSEFWHIHPFREGNTRTSAMMLYFLVKKSGLHVNIDFLTRHNKYFRNALVLTCIYGLSKPEYLLGIVADSTTVKNVDSGKYETIEGIEVNKYTYSLHTMEKLETIQKPKDWKK